MPIHAATDAKSAWVHAGDRGKAGYTESGALSGPASDKIFHQFPHQLELMVKC